MAPDDTRTRAELLDENTALRNREKSRELVRSVEAGEREQVTVRKRFVRKDGSVVWAHATIAAVRNASLGVAELFSGRKQREEELRSPILQMLRLRDAVESEAFVCQERTGMEMGLELPDVDLRPHADRDLAAFRVLKEALTDLILHSQATEARVRLTVEGQDLILEVRDNGVGLTEEDCRKPGAFGLIGMEERAMRLGGRLTIGPGPDGGTSVCAVLPLGPA